MVQFKRNVYKPKGTSISQSGCETKLPSVFITLMKKSQKNPKAVLKMIFHRTGINYSVICSECQKISNMWNLKFQLWYVNGKLNLNYADRLWMLSNHLELQCSIELLFRWNELWLLYMMSPTSIEAVPFTNIHTCDIDIQAGHQNCIIPFS